MTKGKFIVIDGTDGSGKATQTKLLVDNLSQSGYSVVMVDFPQYDEPSSYFVQKYLRGEYGSLEEIGPYQASVFYALDRYDKSKDIRNWLDQGKIVIANRYTSSNMGHQACKISDKILRNNFLSWLEEFEFNLLNIPKPDSVILLYLPAEIGQVLVDKKSDRNYINGRDLHESNLNHLLEASRTYLDLANKYSWQIVNCLDGNSKLRSVDDIHQEVLGLFTNLLR